MVKKRKNDCNFQVNRLPFYDFGDKKYCPKSDKSLFKNENVKNVETILDFYKNKLRLIRKSINFNAFDAKLSLSESVQLYEKALQ